MKFAILGPGAIGGMLACLLQNAGHRVICVSHLSSVARLQNQGLKLKSKFLGNLSCDPIAVTQLMEEMDYVFITTKATQLSQAITALPSSCVKDAVIIPLLNGFEHYDLLRNTFSERVITATIGKVEAYRDEAGVVIHTTPSAVINMATARLISKGRLTVLAELLQTVGIEANILPNPAEVTWSKLVRLCPLAAITAVSSSNVGSCRDNVDSARRLKTLVIETVCVANAEGFVVTAEKVLQQIASLPASLETSLQRDVAKGQLGEMDAIICAVCRLAKYYKINTPALRLVQKDIRTAINSVTA